MTTIRRIMGFRGSATASVSPPGFTDPTSIPDLALWLDAIDSPMTVDGSNLVSEWQDISGNANHATQSTMASQPTYDATAVNGLPAITGNAGEIMDLTTGILADPVTVIIVAQGIGSNTPCGLIGGTDGTIDFYFYNAGSSNGPAIELFDGGHGFNDFRAVEYPPSQPSILTVEPHCHAWTQKSAGGNLRNLWNKTTAMLLTSGSSTDGTGNLGGTYNQIGGSTPQGATYCWHTKIALIVVYSRVLTQQEREDVTNWAINKWSIA